MPIYEYECQKCGKVFETIQKFSDPRLTECLCEEKGPVTKLISAAAFHLKGSGWYVTDFRDKGKGKDGKDDSKGADAGGESDGKSGSADKAAKEGGGESGASGRKEPEKDTKSGAGAGPTAAKAAAD